MVFVTFGPLCFLKRFPPRAQERLLLCQLPPGRALGAALAAVWAEAAVPSVWCHWLWVPGLLVDGVLPPEAAERPQRKGCLWESAAAAAAILYPVPLSRVLCNIRSLYWALDGHSVEKKGEKKAGIV